MFELLTTKNIILYRALSHPTRVKIIQLLNTKNLGVKDISKWIGRRQPNVSQHLHVLKNAQLVQSHKVGKRRVYKIDPHSQTIINYLLNYKP